MARQVSFTRPRNIVSPTAGGAAALVYPAMLVGLALDAGFRHGGGETDIATSFLGALLFLTAAPMAWIFAIDFIDVSRFTVILVGVISSFPLWWLVGSRLSEGAASWLVWLRRYGAVALVWTCFHLLVVAALGSFVT